jgi:hypothetical protein
MVDGPKKNALTREAILCLLSDAEVAKVSGAEDAPRLVDGDEYLDLEDPRSGVRQVRAGSAVRPGQVLQGAAVTTTIEDSP